jgi:hypothetical protein
MKKRAIFVFGIVFVFSAFVIAQTKTITNADLEKFRQKRLQAEKDLRENYAKMGFPSPEELERRNEESRRNLNEFSDRLREERVALESQMLENQNNYEQDSGYNYNNYPNRGFIDYGRYYSPNYYYGTYGNRRYTRKNRKFYGEQDFRQRFINGLPSYVLRYHRFNQLNTNRNLRQNRSNTRIGIRTGRRN